MLNGPEYKAIYTAIRSQNWDTPIQFFGGHSHIRNFAKYDSNAYGIQAGRYMETIGWMSIDGIKGKGKKEDSEDLTSVSFERRYIDNNLYGYYYHTGLDETTFSTEHGKNVSKSIHEARKALDLDYNYGCAPKDLWLNRAPYPSKDSLLTWLEEEVVPSVVVNPDRKNIATLALTNTGAMRFDIFKGTFTRDTTYIVSPFVSRFLYIKDVPYEAAKGVLKLINSVGQIFESAELQANCLAPPEQLSINTDTIAPNLPIHDSFPQPGAQTPIGTFNSPNLVPGYTTKDDAGDDGDDTVHTPISFYLVPNAIQTKISFPEEGDPEAVDLVFIDFIQPWVLVALQFLGATYGKEDVEVYTEETLTELMSGWIKKNWKQDC
jgi:hypothetical protein